MRRSHLRTALGLATALAFAGLAAGAVWFILPRDGAEPGDPADPAQVRLGQTLYGEHCAACHGADLGGQADWRTRDAAGYLPAPPHDASGHSWHHPDAQLFAITKQGTAASAPPGYRTNMLGFADRLSDREIWAVLAFIKSRWPPEIRRQQERITERAAP